MNAADILKAALGHMEDRAATYDKPEGERSMPATVEAFNALTGHQLTAEQGWLFMTVLKLCRTQQGGFRADNYEDGSAYFALMGEQAAGDRVPIARCTAPAEMSIDHAAFLAPGAPLHRPEARSPWITHDGKGCPIDLVGANVYLQRYNGQVSGPHEVLQRSTKPGNDWCWGWRAPSQYSICRYCVA